VSACGAIVPVGLALAQGERPGALALAGCAIALACCSWACSRRATRCACRWTGSRPSPGSGCSTSGANALFAAAATPRLLGSEYPVVTVILAQKLLGERVSRPQAAGIALALIGVGIVSVN
jgi:drug/metabolite transporter (DMT)-like permease